MKRYSDYTDTELVMLLAGGDESAFESIYRRYSDPLYRYVFSRTGVKEDSEEILQEIFLWLWEKRETIAHITALKPYLYNALRNRVVNYFIHNSIRKQYAENYIRFEAGYAETKEELKEMPDIQLILEKRMTGLPENCRTAFRLSRVEQMPIARIAEQMNLSTGTIENYICHALKHLRAYRYDQPASKL